MPSAEYGELCEKERERESRGKLTVREHVRQNRELVMKG